MADDESQATGPEESPGVKAAGARTTAERADRGVNGSCEPQPLRTRVS